MSQVSLSRTRTMRKSIRAVMALRKQIVNGRFSFPPTHFIAGVPNPAYEDLGRCRRRPRWLALSGPPAGNRALPDIPHSSLRWSLEAYRQRRSLCASSGDNPPSSPNFVRMSFSTPTRGDIGSRSASIVSIKSVARLQRRVDGPGLGRSVNAAFSTPSGAPRSPGTHPPSGWRSQGLMIKGGSSRHLFRSTGDGLPQRRKGIGPQPKEDQTTHGEQDHEEGEGRGVGMKPVKARAAQCRPDADTKRKNPKHRAIEFRVIAQPEIAAGEERHQVDLGADAEPAGYGAEKWRKSASATYQDRDAGHW